MPDRIKPYYKQVSDRIARAIAMRKALIDPFRTDDGGFLTSNTKAESEKRQMVLESAIADTAYSMTENGKMIAAVHARSLQGFEKMHGRLPSEDLLASAHQAIENAIAISGSNITLGGVFESADMSTTEGILLRDKLISLVLPVMLNSITSEMTTYIPGDFNQSEFYRVFRVAGSSFGDLKKGDTINYDYDGLYSVMDQRHVLGNADASTTDFKFETKSINGAIYPIRPKRCRIWVNRKQAACDNGSGVIAGTYYDAGGQSVMVSGSVNYLSGEIEVSFKTAPIAGSELHVGFDVNIENEPKLIPRVDHQMFSQTLYPHESAITGDATIQAVWMLRRELGLDLDNLTMQALRNLLSADKDRKHLADMNFHCVANVDWNRVGSAAITLRQHYETLNAALLEVDSILMKGNGVSGLVGIVAGTEACNIFRYLPEPWFTLAPGFRSVAQPHYVGTVFGQWQLYCNPNQKNGWESLCFARGPNHGETAYVAGDAVPALTFRHPVMGDLTQKATMWELAYRDMQPFDGEKYLCRLTMVDEAQGA